MPDLRARSELVRRLKSQLLRAIQGRLLEQRSVVDRARMRLGDPRFLIAERQQYLDDAWGRLERNMARKLNRKRGGLEQLHRRLAFRDPSTVLARARAELGPLGTRLNAAMRVEIGRARRALITRAETLHALSPLAVLARGYAIATLPDGTALRRGQDVGVGDTLDLRLAQGRLDARVLRVVDGGADAAGEDVDGDRTS